MSPEQFNRPDFLIIGAMKSATSSIQEQLEQLPGIFMTEPKEPNFFSNDEEYSKGLAWYSDLFGTASKGDLLGEASTHYTKLPRYPNTVDRLKSYAPDARLVYVMRHPVDRLVSHYVHNWTMGFVSREMGIEESLEQYQNYVSYSLYAMQLQPWFDAYGKDAVLPIFFDRVLAEPQRELERICRFIGYSGEPVWREESEPSNISSLRMRKFPMYSLLIESPFFSWLRTSFIPQSLRDRVKGKLRMNSRPELSASTRQKLEEVFNEDLAVLGTWLSADITCENFRELTGSTPLDWTTR